MTNDTLLLDSSVVIWCKSNDQEIFF